jgi:hypothetical protein
MIICGPGVCKISIITISSRLTHIAQDTITRSRHWHASAHFSPLRSHYDCQRHVLDTLSCFRNPPVAPLSATLLLRAY